MQVAYDLSDHGIQQATAFLGGCGGGIAVDRRAILRQDHHRFVESRLGSGHTSAGDWGQHAIQHNPIGIDRQHQRRFDLACMLAVWIVDFRRPDLECCPFSGRDGNGDAEFLVHLAGEDVEWREQPRTTLDEDEMPRAMPGQRSDDVAQQPGEAIRSKRERPIPPGDLWNIDIVNWRRD